MTVYKNWERLVRATLEREQLRSAGHRPGQSASGLAGAVPPSLGRTTNIDAKMKSRMMTPMFG
ncbi:Callose synthase 10 [Platanthera zijinensis]|uniref:Callose synthase 10 n=1 Tax=Platanthera zijinensis TaxID=2320716 RepID=A0AAP0B3U4_9ASPA